MSEFTNRKITVQIIEADADTQSRKGIDLDYVDELAEAILAGAKLPAPDVFRDPATGKVYMAEGWHRYLAHVKAKKSLILCRVHNGTERDALLFAFGSNQTHGKRRTNADKRYQVTRMLRDKEWSKWSVRKIAETLGVSQSFVAQVRDELDPGKRAIAKEKLRSERARALENAQKQKGLPLSGPAAPVAPAAAGEGESEAFEGLQIHFPAEGVDEDDFYDTSNVEVPGGESGGVAVAAEPAVTIDTLAAPYRRWPRVLSDLRAEFDRISLREDIGGHLSMKITRLDSIVDDLRGLIRQAEPMVICGKCGGEGCQYCQRTGFWTRAVVESQKGSKN